MVFQATERNSKLFGVFFSQILWEFSFVNTSQADEYEEFCGYYMEEGNEGLMEIDEQRDDYPDTWEGRGECYLAHGNPVIFLLRAYEMFQKIQGEELTEDDTGTGHFLEPEDICGLITSMYLPIAEAFNPSAFETALAEEGLTNFHETEVESESESESDSEDEGTNPNWGGYQRRPTPTYETRTLSEAEEEEDETPYFPDPPEEYYDIPPPYTEDFPPLYELPIYSH